MFIGYNTKPFFISVMFSSLGLFKQVDCPEGPRCALPTCIFAHRKVPSGDQSSLPSTATPRPTTRSPDPIVDDGPRKRRKVTGTSQHSDAIASFDTGLPVAANVSEPNDGDCASLEKDASVHKTPHNVSHGSVARSISPPPLRDSKRTIGVTGINADAKNPTNGIVKSGNGAYPTKQFKEPPAESLNPRMLVNPPATHTIRLKLITMMHEQMSRLNDEVKRSDDPSKLGLELSTQELVHAVLDEEEKIAKQSPTIYANVVKNRIGVLKRMNLAAWREERLKVVKQALQQPTISKPQAPKVIETGLSPREELAVLPHLLCRQDGLAKHGYVVAQLSADCVQKAHEGVEAAQNWEVCDRCRTRFQVFPGRRGEDGALTTGGKCRYHPAKPRRPPARDKADKIPKDSTFGCCNENVGFSMGCTTAETHVFKISDPKRLALVMPYVETPENPSLEDDVRAVSFDCEMGYTTHGLELIRLTATSWPSGDTLLDTLVRPLGEILDLNSRFSGVWPSDFNSAALSVSTDCHRLSTELSKPAYAFASSPAVARAWLFDLISPRTPLLGHALENDLNAARIIHPSIIDTCLLYPHPRGLPIRHGLKYLMKQFLNRDVQVQDGGKGHDSAEDARSAGDLVRLRTGEKWKMMQREGWEMKEGTLAKPFH